MKYASDDDDNRTLVKRLYFESDLKRPKEFAEDIIKRAYEAQDIVLEASSTTIGRVTLQTTVLDHGTDLAVWKALTDRSNWSYFLAQLKGNKVAVRDIEAIKRIIENEFELIFEEAKEMLEDEGSYIVLEHVKSFTVVHKRDGMTLRIQR